jgi:hypothetical protein
VKKLLLAAGLVALAWLVLEVASAWSLVRATESFPGEV